MNVRKITKRHRSNWVENILFRIEGKIAKTRVSLKLQLTGKKS